MECLQSLRRACVPGGFQAQGRATGPLTHSPVGFAACRIDPTLFTSSKRLWASVMREDVTSCRNSSAVPLAASKLVTTLRSLSLVA